MTCSRTRNEDDVLSLQSHVLPVGLHQLFQIDWNFLQTGGRAADDGTLLCFVGGAAEPVERLRPVLAAFASDIVHTGALGSAQVAKAANNLVLWACLVADHEALALARCHGLDVEQLRQALGISSAANDALAKWGTQTMAWADDDMAIVAQMARECGLKLPQAEVTREICRALKPVRYQLDKYGR